MSQRKIRIVERMGDHFVLRIGAYSILFDEGDFGVVHQNTWYVTHSPSGPFVFRHEQTAEGKRSVRLHRYLMGAGRGMVVDHINGNPLDNRRKNLRICTYSENNQNKCRSTNSPTPFKGVSKPKDGNRFGAQIWLDNRSQSLGAFDTAEQAAAAYDAAARENFGQFACVNFPRDGEQSALRASRRQYIHAGPDR